MTDLDVLSRMAIATVLGTVLAAGGLAVLTRARGVVLEWPRIIASAAVALVAPWIGVLINLLTAPDGGPASPAWLDGVIRLVCITLMPGVWLMNAFGEKSLEPIPFLGGFVLSSVLWFAAALAFTRRPRARA